MGYKFEEEPNYSKLKFLLKRILLNQDIVPCLKFDWSKLAQHEQLNSAKPTVNNNEAGREDLNEMEARELLPGDFKMPMLKEMVAKHTMKVDI